MRALCTKKKREFKFLENADFSKQIKRIYRFLRIWHCSSTIFLLLSVFRCEKCFERLFRRWANTKVRMKWHFRNEKNEGKLELVLGGALNQPRRFVSSSRTPFTTYHLTKGMKNVSAEFHWWQLDLISSVAISQKSRERSGNGRLTKAQQATSIGNHLTAQRKCFQCACNFLSMF